MDNEAPPTVFRYCGHCCYKHWGAHVPPFHCICIRPIHLDPPPDRPACPEGLWCPLLSFTKIGPQCVVWFPPDTPPLLVTWENWGLHCPSWGFSGAPCWALFHLGKIWYRFFTIPASPGMGVPVLEAFPQVLVWLLLLPLPHSVIFCFILFFCIPTLLEVKTLLSVALQLFFL